MFAIGIIILVAVIALLLAVFTYSQLLIKVPPNRVAVFTGGGSKAYVTGGSKMRNPIKHRVDYLELQPYNVDATASGVPSSDNVPVTVTAFGLIKFGSNAEDLANSTERFLNMPVADIHSQLDEMLSSSLRNIIGTMTVEVLNQDRERFKAAVFGEITEGLNDIGMKIDFFNIVTVTDDNGYLEALGQRRITQVKSEAAIATAEADRDTRVQTALARQAGDLAEFNAETTTAKAREARDIELAQIASRIDAEKAKSAQAGPIADAQARQQLVAAEAQVDARRTTAQIGVAEERAKLTQRERQIDLIDRAQAEAAASQLLAQSNADAAIVTAEAAARSRRMEAEANADAAIQTARGETEARTQAAQALLAEQKAQAEGNLALARAEAEGKQLLAVALEKFGREATMMQLQQMLIPQLPEMITAAAASLGNVGSITVFDGGNGNSGISRLTSQLPQLMHVVTEIAMANGVDIQSLLHGITGSTPASNTPAAPAVFPIDDAPELVMTNLSV